MKVNVCFTPNDFNYDEYIGYNAVVIDVLRATTSIVTACVNGCERVIPVKTVEEALEIKAKYPDALLAGERKGLLIPGFDLGNSPYEYTEEQVVGKTIIMTTTNGTLALSKAAVAHRVYILAFANAASVTKLLLNTQEDIVILCAGSEGQFSLEDALCAGLLADRLSSKAILSDTAAAAQAMYRDFAADLLKKVAKSSHAQYLISIGFANDVALCLEQDTLAVTPVFTNGVVTA
ncbi:putative 2-phosphosulfolactate phosphatase [Sporomusa carbonis]|uniref:2-phosphosulfolactate phosphatase n=1 Tax=Sporomusa carbonis TaxID=3076075 RepID=UPI003A6EE9D7